MSEDLNLEELVDNLGYSNVTFTQETKRERVMVLSLVV